MSSASATHSVNTDVATTSAQKRIDALLAMTLFWGALPQDVLEMLQQQARFSSAEQTLWDQRVAEVTQHTLHEQKHWRDTALRLPRQTESDEDTAAMLAHIHPSHWLPLLKDESQLMQAGLLRLLPAADATSLREALGLAPEKEASEADALPMEPALQRFLLQPLRRKFVYLADVPDSTELDLLSREQLGTFIWQRGLREVAIACRGVVEIETLATFLRRFAPTEAAAIGQQIQRLKLLSPERVTVAQRLLQPYVVTPFNSALLINQVGLDALAIALANSSALRARYTLQKLAPKTFAFLSQRIAFWQTSPSLAIARKTVTETDELAVQVRLTAMP